MTYCPGCGQDCESAPVCRACGRHISEAETVVVPDATTRKVLSGRYQLESELGQGGMATVWTAQDLKHGRKVAVKVIKQQGLERQFAARFLREVEIAARLNHPHILPLFDSGTESDTLYYVMPVVSGGSLREEIVITGRFPIPRAVSLVRQMVTGLAHAHRNNVVHRDLKPENVLIHDGIPLLADFGVATLKGCDSLTAPGVILGTPDYMSPEQVSGQYDLDHRSDIYAIGCILYELVVGHPPFQAGNLEGVLFQHIQTNPAPASSARGDVPESLDRLLMACLSKKPDDRPQSCEQLLELLEVEPERKPVWATGEPFVKGRIVSSLCNRWRQIADVDTFFSTHDPMRGGPKAVVVVGDELAGHASFIERLIETRVRPVLDADSNRNHLTRMSVPWPGIDCDFSIQKRDLKASLIRELDSAGPYGVADVEEAIRSSGLQRNVLLVAEHEIRLSSVAAGLLELVGWYLRDIWGRVGDNGPRILIVLNIVVVSRPGRWHRLLSPVSKTVSSCTRAIEKLSMTIQECPTLVVEPLGEVTRSDVSDWMNRHGILDNEFDRVEQLKRMFGPREAQPMVAIEKSLRELASVERGVSV